MENTTTAHMPIAVVFLPNHGIEVAAKRIIDGGTMQILEGQSRGAIEPASGTEKAAQRHPMRGAPLADEAHTAAIHIDHQDRFAIAAAARKFTPRHRRNPQ